MNEPNDPPAGAGSYVRQNVDHYVMNEPNDPPAGTGSYKIGWSLLAIAYLAFISLGLPDAVTGVAWPSMWQALSLHQGQLGLILIGTGVGYFSSGFLAGRMTQSLGLGGLLAGSCCLVACAMGGFIFMGRMEGLMLCGVVWGLGSGGIDAALNHYAASHFPARHMSWLHACYSLGASLGPLVMTVAIVGLQSWRLGYLVVALAMMGMMFAFIATKSQWNQSPEGSSNAVVDVRSGDSPEATLGLVVALKTGRVWLHAMVFLFYTGTEALYGQWSFSWLRESRAFTPTTAGMAVGGYFAAIAMGRIISGLLVERVGTSRMILGSMILVVIATLTLILRINAVMIWSGLILLGVGLAAIFPCLMSETPKRLGSQLAQHAVGFQVAFATLGASGIPAVTGFVLERYGMESVPRIGWMIASIMCVVHALALISDRLPQTERRS